MQNLVVVLFLAPLIATAGFGNDKNELYVSVIKGHAKVSYLDSFTVEQLKSLYYCDSKDSICVHTPKDSIVSKLILLAKQNNVNAALFLSEIYLNKEILPSTDTVNIIIHSLGKGCESKICDACFDISVYYNRLLLEKEFKYYFEKLQGCGTCTSEFEYYYFMLNNEFFPANELPRNYTSLKKISSSEILKSIELSAKKGCALSALYMFYYYHDQNDLPRAEIYREMVYTSADYDSISKVILGIFDSNPGFKLGNFRKN